MADSQAMQAGSGAGDSAVMNPTDWSVGWKPLFWGIGLVMASNVFLWFWNYWYMFTAGLDSASWEFTLYYRSLFWAELVILGVFAGGWLGWLIRTGREMEGKPVERAEQVRRVAILWSLIGVTSFAIYLEASFWPNWDGSWHQTMVPRHGFDTDPYSDVLFLLPAHRYLSCRDIPLWQVSYSGFVWQG